MLSDSSLHRRLTAIEHEDVTRTFPEGLGRVELACVNVVEKGLSQSASFALGPQTLFTL